jgi:hypothetical protein
MEISKNPVKLGRFVLLDTVKMGVTNEILDKIWIHGIKLVRNGMYDTCILCNRSLVNCKLSFSVVKIDHGVTFPLDMEVKGIFCKACAIAILSVYLNFSD